MRSLPAILILSMTSLSGFGQTNTADPFVPLVNIPGTTANLAGGVKGIAVDAAGSVFFTSGGYSVLRWDATTGILTSVAGNGTPGFSGDNGPATSAQLDGAIGVAADRAGNLYIADANNFRVRKVSSGVITTAAGGGSIPGCDNCPAASAYLRAITGVAADSAGNLYIFADQRIRKVSNGLIEDYSSLYSDVPSFNLPGAAALDSAGDLYVPELYNSVVRKFSNGVSTIVAGTFFIGFSGDNGPATSARLFGPRGAAVDSAGNLYIADTGNQRIRKVSSGVITTVAGGGPLSGGLGDNGPATSGLLNFPFGVGVDTAGTLYIEDTLDYRIRKVSNGVITTIAGGGSVPVLLARSAGKFSATASMSTTRAAHTATLLENGKVLIAGGYAGLSGDSSIDSYLASAELYDPTTRTFATTGSMIAALGETTATLLPDGRVLVVGTPPSNSGSGNGAQLYDSSIGSFTTAGSLRNISHPRTATLLNTGKVLITGDAAPNPVAAAAELYDPAGGTFTPAGSMRWSHFNPAAALLPSGKVLIAEGACTVSGNDSGSELYDPATDSFSATIGAMPCVSAPRTATLLASGKVLIESLGGAELYDPFTGIFTSSGGTREYANTATLLADKTVLFTGGFDCTTFNAYCADQSTAEVSLYDPSTGTFGRVGLMTTPRGGQRATWLFDGTVLISGGDWQTPDADTILSSVEIYTPPVLAPAPQLFSVSGDGRGQGAIWHTDTAKIASPDDPAAAGNLLAMYTTSLIGGGVIPPQVAVGGKLAEILYFGDAPGYPGYFQVNFRTPSGVAPGPAVPVRLMYLNRSSNAVSIAVQ